MLSVIFLAAMATGQHKGDPALDQLARQYEARFKSVEARLNVIESRINIPTVGAAKPAATVPASDLTNPTWHYPEGTTLVQDANGVLVPSKAATHISYPGQPMQVAPPPQFYAPPPVMYQQRGGLFRGRMFRGGNCSGGS